MATMAIENEAVTKTAALKAKVEAMTPEECAARLFELADGEGFAAHEQEVAMLIGGPNATPAE